MVNLVTAVTVNLVTAVTVNLVTAVTVNLVTAVTVNLVTANARAGRKLSDQIYYAVTAVTRFTRAIAFK